MVQDVSLAAGVLILILLPQESRVSSGATCDSRAGRRRDAPGRPLQGAILGLLGLLLAFSFAAAGARFLERQDLIVQEANAIGTAYLRADLLDELYRSELRAALKR